MTINFQGLYDKNLRKFLRFFGRHLNCQPIVVGRGGFEPPKSKTSDLQSDPFGRSGICPYGIVWCGAGDWTRTHNLLITNQLLCQLSYSSSCSYATFCFSAVAASDGKSSPNLSCKVELEGLEPSASCLQGRHSPN